MLREVLWGLALILPAMADSKQDFARGVLEEARGNAGSEWFEKAREGDPEAWPLVDQVAGDRLAAGDLAGATTLLREFARNHPARLGAQLAYVDFLRKVAPNDDLGAKLACETLEKAHECHPGKPAVIRRLFRVYEQRGQREQSIELFESVSGERSSGAALAAADMARTLFSEDDELAREKLDELFSGAMKSSPGDPVLARAASEHFRKTGRLDQAVDLLQRHVEVMPSSLELRVRTGVLHLAAGEMDQGELILKEVLKIDPRKALAHQALAKLYRKQGDPDQGRPHAAELLKIRGGDADEFVALAQDFLGVGMMREARLLLEKGLYDHPEDAGIAVHLAIATRRDPETRAAAVRRFREAESLSGADGPATDPEFLREFAEILLESGQTKAAEDRLRAAIKSYPPESRKEMASALRRLAEIWLSGERNEAAAKSLLKRAEVLEKK